MRLEQQYLSKAWTQAAMEQVAHEYKAKGYRVTRDERLGRHHADLVARKGREQVIIEFKYGPWSREQHKSALALRKRIQQMPDSSFRVVLVSPPSPAHVEVDGLAEVLAALCEERGHAEERSGAVRVTIWLELRSRK
jgi:hypothetical protein